MHCPRDTFQSTLDLGDCVGLESCVDMRPSMEDIQQSCMAQAQAHKPSCSGRRNQRMERAAEKEYPPPIHMPWIMKRYVTDDGRLVIKEEKVKRQEYFQADRSVNGRLTLRLIPLLDEKDDVVENLDEEEEVGINVDNNNNQTDIVEEEEEEESRGDNNGGAGVLVGGSGGSSGGGQCYMYSSNSRNSCMLVNGVVGVGKFRPVHSTPAL